MSSISIIVPVFEQWHLVPLLIDEWKNQAVAEKCALIIVDNGSSHFPITPALQGLTILKCLTPGSYAARNAGLAITQSDLVLFTDGDCLPDRQWLNEMIRAYERSDKRTLLAGNIVIKSQNMLPSTAELYDIAAGLPQERYVSKGYAVTANLAIPRVIFDEVGMFDEQRFSGGDAEFCQRALKAGFNLKFVPEAVVYHPARTTWNEYATKVRRMKGGQIRAGKYSRRFKYFLITLIPPFWRVWRTAKSHKLKTSEKVRVLWFQFRLWIVELIEMFALLLGKTPERR